MTEAIEQKKPLNSSLDKYSSLGTYLICAETLLGAALDLPATIIHQVANTSVSSFPVSLIPFGDPGSDAILGGRLPTAADGGKIFPTNGAEAQVLAFPASGTRGGWRRSNAALTAGPSAAWNVGDQRPFQIGGNYG